MLVGALCPIREGVVLELELPAPGEYPYEVDYGWQYDIVCCYLGNGEINVFDT